MAKDREKSEYVFGEQFEPDVFWEEHGRQILGVILLIVVAGVGLFIWQRQATAKAEQAADQLLAAQDIGALESVRQQYAGQEIGALATMRLADLCFQQGRWDDAARQFETFLREYPNHEFAPSARLGLAAVEESRGNLEAAKGLYTQLTGTAPGNYVALAARRGLGRCAEALGQTNEALRVYEELMALTQGSPQRMDAYFRTTILARGLPQGAATNPMAPATVPERPESNPGQAPIPAETPEK